MSVQVLHIAVILIQSTELVRYVLVRQLYMLEKSSFEILVLGLDQ